MSSTLPEIRLVEPRPRVQKRTREFSDTIANQLYTIYRKLGVGARDELVARLTSPRAGETSSEPGESN